MKTIVEAKNYQKILRVRDFVESHRDLFPPESLGASMVAMVTGAATLDMPGFTEKFCIAGRETAIQARNASRANVRSAMAKGLAAVKRLDAIVRNKLREDPVTLEVWIRAMQFERPARGKADTSETGSESSPASAVVPV